ncbi:RNA-directed DNA polymerase, eukaryota [Tanacetum coccineum]|uniref:RNA-directed DNA polymerase, eukaryota n=1 Tax=Tanacetum coccineum TaxID=301880 RepID=A0ABQ5BWP7_9ASTR
MLRSNARALPEIFGLLENAVIRSIQMKYEEAATRSLPITLLTIGSKWGDVLELEDDHDDLFARKRLCIKTKHEENILESFKIIVKGKVFCVRAKELFVWNPTFKDIPEAVHCSDDESIKGEAEMNGEDSKLNNDGDASDSEVVSDTYFGDNADEQGYENEQGQSFNAKEFHSRDKSTNVINEKEVSDAAEVRSNSKSDGGNSRILEEVENIDGCFSSEGRNIGVKPKEGDLFWSGLGSTFNVMGLTVLITFISSSGLIDVQLEGYAFTWAHPSASKMSKLDRFLVSDGLIPHLSQLLLQSGLIGFFLIIVSDQIGNRFWIFFSLDDNNGMIRLKRSLEIVEKEFVRWVMDYKRQQGDGLASILVNGSPTSEFQFHRGLKQGDPLAPFLFILIMESLHLSFSRAVEAGIFTGIEIGSSLTISHLFYADDAVFIGEWSHNNLKGIMNILRCFSLLSGLSINVKKSQLLGIGISDSIVSEAAKSLGCSIMKTPFKYLGIPVGGNMSLIKAWDESIVKLKRRLSKWKLKTLSIGGRLTLLKSVLGSTPIYNMSLFKVPKSVLHSMESLRRNFFNGIQEGDKKIAWVKWPMVLASKKHGGLGVSSFYALNRGLLFKWVWRYISQDNSLWARVISALHGSSSQVLSASFSSLWKSILNEVKSLKAQGVDLISHCKIRVGNGMNTSFWNDCWIGDSMLKHLFPRLFALETIKDISVADKFRVPITCSFRRPVRGGLEAQQLDHLMGLIESTLLSNSEDRWVWDLNGDGVFRVKDVRNLLDETFLPKADTPTRWIKCIPIKVNVFVWKALQDRLPTRSNLVRRNILIDSLSCPICDGEPEDSSHLFFRCCLARDVTRLVCRWWDLDFHSFNSYTDWQGWFKQLRLGAKSKEVLEGVFYVSWWSLWNFRNHLLFADSNPRKDAIFDEIVLRSFNWCLARGNRTLNWVSWLQHPHLISM